ncbi:hypothetical protein OPV22_027175 [Ensete ventricosum]|uniref:Uncharacterized protein n=1 Tax=Ensete ventricosum TaxID=4639 RepID=A0AAV8Q328_ENSVE|nr:hypothetical protein OPV22_027175 [Ensete ventricosum]
MSAELRRLLLAQESSDGLPTVLRYLYSAFPPTSVPSLFSSRSPGSGSCGNRRPRLPRTDEREWPSCRDVSPNRLSFPIEGYLVH